MAAEDEDRLGDLVRYALAQHVERAGGVPVLVVEKPNGRRRVLRGRSAQPSELKRMVKVLAWRSARADRRAALVWSVDWGASGPVRYAYCRTPDHREGVLLAQRYSGAEPVGDPEPADRWDLPAQWRPVALSPGLSPSARAAMESRNQSGATMIGVLVSLLVGIVVAEALIWGADRIGGIDTVGVTVVDKGFDPDSRGSDFSIELRSDDGGRVYIDRGDVETVWHDVGVGDHIQVLTSGFTGRPMVVQTAHSSHQLAGGWGEPVGWLLFGLVVVWLTAKALTWPRFRRLLLWVAPLGVVSGVVFSLFGR